MGSNMMREELGLIEDKQPLDAAITTFTAFNLVELIPLIPFIFVLHILISLYPD